MSLPPFKDLEIYALGQGDLPQRFYVDPEHENFADWELAGKTFKVHSQVLAMSSKVFCGMCQDTQRPTEAIELPGSSTATLAETLALLRFIYEPKSVTLENIHLLSLQGSLEGVLRLANGIDCSFLDDLKYYANQLLLNWPTEPSAPSVSHAASQVNHEFNHVKVIRQFSIDIGDDDLHEGCYEYVQKRLNAVTSQASHQASVEDAVELARELSDYPDLLRAGFFHSLVRKANYTGKTIRRVLDCENYIPNALYTFKFQVTGNEEQRRIRPMHDPKNEEFKWNEDRYEVYILRREGKYKLGLGFYQKIPQGPNWKVDMTFRIFNWTDPSKSSTFSRRFDFSNGTALNYYSRVVLHSLEELKPFLDEDGILYVQVTELKEIAPPRTPPCGR